MTTHLSKLIEAFKFYNWKRIKTLYCFLYYLMNIFIYLRNPTAANSLPFDVLHHIFFTSVCSYVHSICKVVLPSDKIELFIRSLILLLAVCTIMDLTHSLSLSMYEAKHFFIYFFIVSAIASI